MSPGVSALAKASPMLISSTTMCRVAFLSLVIIVLSLVSWCGVHRGHGLLHLGGGTQGPICSRASDVAASVYSERRDMVGHSQFPARTCSKESLVLCSQNKQRCFFFIQWSSTFWRISVAVDSFRFRVSSERDARHRISEKRLAADSMFWERSGLRAADEVVSTLFWRI